jgi:L-ascorbate metabolism protein UlaG (beta-lactamase superfamily)
MQLFRFILLILLIILNVYAFTHERYENISKGGSPSLFNLVKWKLSREKPQWPQLPLKNNLDYHQKINSTIPGSEISITYINHSSFLIQTAENNILIDPVWSEYAGPFGKFGIKRSIYPGVSLEQLPAIDFILISHSHYDHLDLPTIEKIVKNNNPIIVTGLGLTDSINYCRTNQDSCFELDWWDNLELEDSPLKIHFVPAHHWSSRNLFDKNTTLWGGFVIENAHDNIYFAGDTGFADSKIFHQIKDRFNHFTVSLLPIGAYKPNWFFSEMHTSPEEAIKIAQILDTRYMIPIHYDTFQLSDEQYQDPLHDLNKAITKYHITNNKVHIMLPGQTFKLQHK